MQLQPATSEAAATLSTPTITLTVENQHVASPLELTKEVPINTHLAPREPALDETYEALGTLLRERGRNYCDHSDTFFWPLKLLKDTLTRERVLKVLSVECGKFDKKNSELYCNWIVPNTESLAMGDESLRQRPQSYLKIFAILLLLGRGKDIETFVGHQMCDERLPLVNLNRVIYTEKRSLSGKEEEIQKCFKVCHMGSPEIDLFCSYQRGITVHFFDLEDGNKVKHYDLSRDTMLPWLPPIDDHLGNNSDREGGHSSVKRYRIDPDSHGFQKLLQSVTHPISLFELFDLTSIVNRSHSILTLLL